MLGMHACMHVYNMLKSLALLQVKSYINGTESMAEIRFDFGCSVGCLLSTWICGWTIEVTLSVFMLARVHSEFTF